jgi:glutathione S-transferase
MGTARLFLAGQHFSVAVLRVYRRSFRVRVPGLLLRLTRPFLAGWQNLKALWARVFQCPQLR